MYTIDQTNYPGSKYLPWLDPKNTEVNPLLILAIVGSLVYLWSKK